MIRHLNTLIAGICPASAAEFADTLTTLVDGHDPSMQLREIQKLQADHPAVYRLNFESGGASRSVVVKRMRPCVAKRNELVARRWLPAARLEEYGPPLIGVFAESGGGNVWHIYSDLGDWSLNPARVERESVKAVITALAEIHSAFVDHPLLPECRLHGGDLGAHFFTSNVHDAWRCLEAVRPPAVDLSAEHRLLRDSLLERLGRLIEEEPKRTQALVEIGGPETLVHGDLWTSNTYAIPDGDVVHARFIDWDHVAVGQVAYDLSTFLLRFDPDNRPWILEMYRSAMERFDLEIPDLTDLNLLFETAEYSRITNRLIWPAIALVHDKADWGFDMLREVGQWLDDLRPVMPDARKENMLP